MATPRLTFALLVVALLATGYALFFEPHLESTDTAAAAAHRLVALRADQVQALKLRRDEWTSAAVQRLDGATFQRTEPAAGAADSAAVAELLSELEFAAPVARLAGDGADTQHLYDEGFTPPHLAVTITLADHRTLELELGNETPTGDGTYLRARDGTDVLVAPPSLKRRLDQLLDALTETHPADAARSDGTAAN